MRVIVVGGGAIGMMQARALALEGVEVIVLEKGLCGREASWAGGGIVSPLYPWRYDPAVTVLARWSQQFYPNLAVSLEEESGISPELSRHGLLMLSVEDEQAAVEWGQDERWLRRVDRQEIHALEPQLREGFETALWMPQVASIRNPRLVRALRGALDQLPNVEIVENCPVTTLIQADGVVRGVQAGEQTFEADATIVAAGAWSAGLLASVGIDWPVQPVKGQMVLFQGAPGLVRRVVLRDGKYVIPRQDGLVLAGSTLEFVGFDKQTTSDARDALTDAAIDLYPALADCPVVAHWAGLRPGMEGGVPMIGAVDGCPGLYVNNGHFRNGLVLAPASVALLTAILLEKPLPFPADPYRPGITPSPAS